MEMFELIGTDSKRFRKHIGKVIEFEEIETNNPVTLYFQGYQLFRTSIVKNVSKLYGCYVLKTLNSIYIFKKVE